MVERGVYFIVLAYCLISPHFRGFEEKVEDMPEYNGLVGEFSEKEKLAVNTKVGNLLVQAASGASVDDLLLARIINLFQDKGNILFLTTSRARCTELLDILREYQGYDGMRLKITTIESFCLEQINQSPLKALGWEFFSVWDAKDQMAILTRLLEEKNVNIMPSEALSEIVRAKNSMISCEEYAASSEKKSDLIEKIAPVFETYEKLLEKNHALDPIDVVIGALKKIETEANPLKAVTHLIIDEFQDMSPIRFQLVKVLSKFARSTCVVGDSTRALANRFYSGEAAFRNKGQLFNPINEFRLACEGVIDIQIHEGFDLAERIKRFASAILSQPGNLGGVSAYEASNEIDEANFLIRRIRELLFGNQMKYGEFAVIYRRDEQLAALKQLMKKHALPHYMLGESLFLKPSVKHLLSYGRLIINPMDDEALETVINLPRRGVGKRTLETLGEMSEEKGFPLGEALRVYSDNHDNPSRTRAILKTFLSLIERYRELVKRLNAFELLQKLIDEIDLKKHYTKQNTAAAEREWVAIESFMNFLKQWCVDNPELKLDLVVNTSALPTEYDHAATEHNAVALAKATRVAGFKFPVVFLVGMEDGLFPFYRPDSRGDTAALSRIVDAERRLFYLTMSRASKALCFVWARERRLRTASTQSEKSRFIDELGIDDLKIEKADMEKLQEATRPAQSDLMSQVKVKVRDYEIGDRVNHPMWGMGTVVEQIGMGAEAELAVDFVNEGRKTLLLRYAPLKKVQD